MDYRKNNTLCRYLQKLQNGDYKIDMYGNYKHSRHVIIA